MSPPTLHSPPPLHQFVARVLADDRILFGDLKRLQRDILPARITTREEAEILLFLDSAVHRADREWTDYLTATVRDFALWGLQPAGSVDRDKAAWLSGALSRGEPTKTARTILREIVDEARSIDDDALVELGMGAAAARTRPVPARQRQALRRPAQHRLSWPAEAGPAGDGSSLARLGTSAGAPGGSPVCDPRG